MKLLGRRKRGKPLKRFMCVVKEDTDGWCDKRILVGEMEGDDSLC